MKSWSGELIKTDLFMAILVGYYGRIVGRSGLANMHGITVNNEMIWIIKDMYVWSFSIFPLKNLLRKLVIALNKWLLNVALSQSLLKLANLLRRKLKEEREVLVLCCLMWVFFFTFEKVNWKNGIHISKFLRFWKNVSIQWY